MQKILVIEDDEPIRQVMLMALQKKGFEMLEAENGEVGLRLARIHLPDLILSDIKMAAMDGYTALTELRRDPATAAIPVILMTGQPHSEGMRQGMELGADDYLPKPFTMPALLASVEARLKKQAALRSHAEKKMADLRSNISLALPHELFTPLSGIIGFAEILTSEAASLGPDQITEIGRHIHSSTKRLYRLMENFLIYAQIEMLRMDSQKLESLRKVQTQDAESVVETYARQAAERSNRVKDLVLDLRPGVVAMSEDYLARIVTELLDNAFKFSSPGSFVHICTLSVKAGFSLTVMDRGRGMSPQQVSSIGAYMQFGRKMHEQQGPGLGLAIVKSLVELHGGHMAIHSELGVGTTVTAIIRSD